MSSQDSADEDSEWEDVTDKMEELDTLSRIPSLATELQNHIIGNCGTETLYVLSRLNKEWYKRSLPHLWGNIDFREFDEDGESKRKFFATCHNLIESTPHRWTYLSSLVQHLYLGNIRGINIVLDEDWDDNEFAYFDTHPKVARNIFDVIANFKNLKKLSVYVMSEWGYGSYDNTGQALASGLTKLSHVTIGGEMPSKFISGLLSRPENIEHLAIYNLHESPGQDNGPNVGSDFGSQDASRFTNLKSLYLSKLADMDGRDSYEEEDDDNDDGPEYDSGMRWPFPRESETETLEEWAEFLKVASKTLESVTLENRYLHSHPREDMEDRLDPGGHHPDSYGAFSRREFLRIFLPVFELELPRLKDLVLIGMGTEAELTPALCHLEPRVDIEQRPGGFVHMGGDVTPEDVDPPSNFGDD